MKLQLAIVFAFVAITHCAPPNPCDSAPCGRGTCFLSADNTGFICSCQEGFSGDRCQYGPCDSSPCVEGICLTSSIRNSYTCMCPSNREGRNCEIALDGCGSDPCLNGGVCMSSSSDSMQYVCACASGFSGRVCENGQDGCDSNPCLNGGVCMSSSSDSRRYVCVCASGISGRVCDQVDPCFNNPCHNGGTCQQEATGYSCKCHPQFVGTQCQLQMTCALNPCRNGGSCYLNYNDGITYMCKCPDNFKGKDCSKPDPCLSNPCANNSVCLTEDDGSFSCLCRCGTDGSCSNTNNGEGGDVRPSLDDIQCNNLMRASGNCTGRGECAFDTNRLPYCRCDASYYGLHCQYAITPTPDGGGDMEEGLTTSGSVDSGSTSPTPGGDVPETFDTAFMCPDSTDVLGCRFVFIEMNKCNNRGCCSSDLRGGAKCSCRDGYGGNKCQYECARSPNGCGSGQNADNENEGTGGTSNGESGTNGAGTGGTGSGGTGAGTSGTGTDADGGVRPQVDRDPFVCPDVPSSTPSRLACGRVGEETNDCSSQGCCSIDEDGDARCSCYHGYGGPSCAFNCAVNPDGCSGANGAGGSSAGGAGTGGTGTNGGGGVRPQVVRDFVCQDVPSSTPYMLACGRVGEETNDCSSQGCCSIDEDGDARCSCYHGYGGPSCAFNCALEPEKCGTASGTQ